MFAVRIEGLGRRLSHCDVVRNVHINHGALVRIPIGPSHLGRGQEARCLCRVCPVYKGTFLFGCRTFRVVVLSLLLGFACTENYVLITVFVF
jgi:hypothetical protein